MQWGILREAFHGHRTLVLIGDPKQAIYGFRGADVHAYLEAKDVGHRSCARCRPTGAATRCCSTAWTPSSAARRSATRASASLPVTAAHTGRLVDAPAPVRLRVLPRDGLALTSNGTAKTRRGASDAIARDLAAQVVALLSGGATVHPRDGSAAAHRAAAATSRCSSATNSQARARAVVPARRRRPGRAHRQDECLLDAGRRGVAGAAGGARAAAPHDAGTPAGAELLRRARRRRARRAAATTSPTTSRCGCAIWGNVLEERGRRGTVRERCRCRSRCSAASSGRSAASGC